MWECDFHRMMKEDEGLQAFVEAEEIATPIKARDTFFGGRVNGLILHYECQPNEEIKVLDFTSLYPWVSVYNIKCSVKM